MVKSLSKKICLCAFLALIVAAQVCIGAEPNIESVRQLAKSAYGLNNAELDALNRGENVVKQLDQQTNVRLRSPELLSSNFLLR